MKTKTNKIGLTHRSVMGALAKCAVQQSPYHRPENLEVVLDKLHEAIKGEFDDGMNYVKFFPTWKDAHDWLQSKLILIPEFLLWNERKNGNKAPYSFVSRYGSPEADNDFIDLDALIRNVTSDAISTP